MQFAVRNKSKLIRLYVKEGKSTYEIAKEFDTYSNKIIRALKHLGVERRDYGEAQKKALQSGRAEHPTEGKTHTAERKKEIAKQMGELWENMSDEERERRSQMSREQWEKMPAAKKDEMRRLGAMRIRQAAKEGSKDEKFVREGLTKAGFEVQYHVKNLIPSEKLEVDIWVPSLKTAIEIDGPSHFLPIWGEERLAKTREADTKKGGLILSKGYALIRVKQTALNMSNLKRETMLTAVIEKLEKIKKRFPSKDRRLIEIEIS